MRDRFSLIGHEAMALMNPLAEDELLALLGSADLGPGEHVLDLGGGRADLARICVERFRCTATSVDRSPAACEAARDRTHGLGVDVVCQDAQVFLDGKDAGTAGLAAALGALHAFGSGLPGWTSALEALRPRARHVLVGDLVAIGPRAAAEMDVATMAQITPLLSGARKRVVLPPARVLAYERAWCDAVESFLRAHPGDPRSAWAEERIAWSRAPAREAAWRELAFVAMMVPGEPSAHEERVAPVAGGRVEPRASARDEGDALVHERDDR